MARIVPWIDQYRDAEVIDIDANLERPNTVSLTLEGHTLYASGSAPRQWIANTRAAAPSLPGITAYNDEQLVDADQQAWETLTQTINSAVFYFEFGGNTLAPGQDHNLQLFIESVKRLAAFSDVLDRPTQIDIVGHADRVGGEAYNLAISRRRAQTVADILTGADIADSFLSVKAAGSQDPMRSEIEDDNPAVNRRVIFAVRPVSR